jgi:hypothetical protein
VVLYPPPPHHRRRPPGSLIPSPSTLYHLTDALRDT